MSPVDASRQIWPAKPAQNGTLASAIQALGLSQDRVSDDQQSVLPLGRSNSRRASRFAPCLLALAGIFACTWAAFLVSSDRLGQGLGSMGFLYLVFVVLAAVYGGFWQATWVSVVAVACLDYFFDPPIFSFTVGRLSNYVELTVFEFTALIISQLWNRAHVRELEAAAERRDTSRLYQTARRNLLINSPGDPGSEVARLIREMFDLRAVLLFDAQSGNVYICGSSGRDREQRTKDAYCLDSDAFESEEGDWYCALRLGVRPVGALALCGTGMSKLTATAAASLAAIALERARIIEQQCEAEAGRQAERLRTAVLDALAHKFKTPLTVIRTASSGLPAAGALSELQRELISLIDQEARKVNDLATQLVGSPKLDSAEFDPQPEPLLFSRLFKAAVQELEQERDRERFSISVPAAEPAVFADRELVLTALDQLIDNALKYSVPASPIEVEIAGQEGSVVLRVRSKGLVVSDADRERIFERFYRAAGAQSCATGTGLGLSIVKTIASDHRGAVWAKGEPGYGTAFSFSLPLVPSGVSCD